MKKEKKIMADVVKVTNKEMFAKIKEVLVASDVEGKEDLIAFVDSRIALIEKKAAKAAETAAEKKNELDELCEVVKSILGTEPQTADDVFAQVSGEDVTIAKVRARLTKLEKAGIAVKSDVKVDGKTKKAYVLA